MGVRAGALRLVKATPMQTEGVMELTVKMLLSTNISRLTFPFSVAGIVGGEGVGVARAVSLVAVKVLSDKGRGWASDM